MATDTTTPNRATEISRGKLQNIEQIHTVIAAFKGTDLLDRLLNGMSMGADCVYTSDREAPSDRYLKSPVSALVEAPAWEGSGLTAWREHDVVYAVGAAIGGFAQRAGIDVYELIEGAQDV